MNDKNVETTEKELLDALIVETAQPVSTSVIWLHGLGADGHDFGPIVPQLRLPEGAAVRFVFPHAPIRPVTINNGYEMRAWYDITSMDIADPQRADKATIALSVDQTRALIEHEIAQGIPAERIILAGFSQGGVIALQTALQYEQTLGGVMVLSSYIALADELQQSLHVSNRDLPIFLAHGLYDAVLPYALAEQTQQYLQEWGYTVTYHDYPMEHNVCADEIVHISTWLSGLAGVQA